MKKKRCLTEERIDEAFVKKHLGAFTIREDMAALAMRNIHCIKQYAYASNGCIAARVLHDIDMGDTVYKILQLGRNRLLHLTPQLMNAMEHHLWEVPMKDYGPVLVDAPHKLFQQACPYLTGSDSEKSATLILNLVDRSLVLQGVGVLAGVAQKEHLDLGAYFLDQLMLIFNAAQALGEITLRLCVFNRGLLFFGTRSAFIVTKRMD